MSAPKRATPFIGKVKISKKIVLMVGYPQIEALSVCEWLDHEEFDLVFVSDISEVSQHLGDTDYWLIFFNLDLTPYKSIQTIERIDIQVLHLISLIKHRSPNTYKIITAFQRTDVFAIKAFKAGIDDYIVLEPNMENLGSIVLKAIRTLSSAEHKTQLEIESVEQPLERLTSQHWLELSPVSTLVLDRNLTVRGANERATNLLMLEKAGLINAPLANLFPQKQFEALEQFLKSLNESTNDRLDNIWEGVILSGENNSLPVQCQLRLSNDENFSGYILHIEDITQKLTRKAKSHYHVLWQELFAHYAEAFILTPVNEFLPLVKEFLYESTNLIAAQRGYLYFYNDQSRTFQLEYEWSEKMEKSLRQFSGSIIASHSMVEIEQLLSGRKLFLNPIRQVQKTAINSGLGISEHLAQVDTHSAYILPIIGKQSVVGFIGFDFEYAERDWQSNDSDYIDKAVDIINRALMRKSNEEIRRLTHLKLIETHGKLSQQACIDSLTQLANRRYFDRVLDSEVRRAIRDNSPLTVLFCDIDYFKSFNDYYGHVEGDKCLAKVASAINDSFKRGGDLVARYGGEEFTIILPTVCCLQAFEAAEKMRNEIQNLNIPHLKSPLKRVTVSVGVGCIEVPEDGGLADILRRADRALYLAKNRGRNKVMVFEKVCAKQADH